MTDYPYDPELPFVVTWEGAESSARFPDYGRAADYAQFSRGKVIDTTPAPKIPADAEFIHWSDGDSPWYARRTPFGLWEDDCGEERTLDGLVKFIADAEVVVLKRA